MIRLSQNKDFNLLIHQLLQRGWRYRKGKKHYVLITPSNRKIALPSTPSDSRRGIRNFRRATQRLEQGLH